MKQAVYSLKKSLTRYTSIFSVVIGCLLMVSAYYLALEETSEILDGQMRTLAERVALHHPEPISKDFDPQTKYHEEDLFVDVWLYQPNQQSKITQTENPEILTPRVKQAGYYHINRTDGDWYSYVLPLADRQIQVSQQMSVRHHLALELAWSIILPYLLIMPIAIAALSWIIGRSLKPLDDFKMELAQRQSHDLQHIQAARYPLEIQPTIEEMNQLFAKISQAQQEQKQFIADAAHELRSPITALNLQSKILMQQFPHTHALHQLNTGLVRMQHLVNQLLNLARQDASLLHQQNTQQFNLKDITLNCIEQLLGLAMQKELDLGMTEQQDILLDVNQESVHSIIYNVLDNAIKYTPQHGVINVAIFEQDDYAIIQIEDSGEGIAPELYDDVIKQFYRVHHHLEVGSGLGLSIVDRAVERLGGSLSFSKSQALGGLQVNIALPR